MPRSLTLTVPDSKWDDFKFHFLITHPNQTLETTLQLSDDDWVWYRILLFAQGSYEKGINQVFTEQNKPVIDKDIIKII